MKAIRNIVLYIVICLTLVTSAFAVNSDCEESISAAAAYSDTARAEEVVWVYKTIDGVEYMRLWSRTRGIWLTDWIPAE